MVRSMCCWRGQCVQGAICAWMGYQASVRQKNNLSTKSMMLITSALIRGIRCGIVLDALAWGKPVYITSLLLIASEEKYHNRLALPFQGNGLNNLGRLAAVIMMGVYQITSELVCDVQCSDMVEKGSCTGMYWGA
jgi:hypothetical protein